MADSLLPDSAIHDFVQDPWAFLQPCKDDSNDVLVSTVVSAYNLFAGHTTTPGGVPDSGNFIFVLDYKDLTRRTFEIKYYGAEESIDTVQAYILGYNGGAQRSRTPAFIDIPKAVEEGTLLFTGTLSGCSVVVTNLTGSTYRVFHDSRMASSLLYDNVEMAVDYENYSIGSNLATACVFMQYRNGQWKMFVQLQTLEHKGDRTFVVQRRTELGPGMNYFPILVCVPGSYDAKDVRALFDARRKSNRECLSRRVSEALPAVHIPSVLDGEFQSFEGTQISLQNPAIRHSQAIRDVISQAQNGIPDQFIEAEGEEVLLSVSQLGQVNCKKLIDSLRRESEELDLAYLWIKQKELNGFDAVVIPRRL